LKLQYDEPLSDFALSFNLRPGPTGAENLSLLAKLQPPPTGPILEVGVAGFHLASPEWFVATEGYFVPPVTGNYRFEVRRCRLTPG
jgi:hypothetical protein